MCMNVQLATANYNYYCTFWFTTDIDDLQDVLEAVVDVNEWLKLGLALGLRQPTLDNITQEHKIQMLTRWLNQVDECQPSWNALVVALRSSTVQCNDVAAEVEQSHPS